MNLKLFLIFILCSVCNCELKLKKVIILSRHNIRTPLYKELHLLSPKKWPVWPVQIGELTPKGALLENHLGEYFSTWLRGKRLFNSRCPSKRSVFVYSNSLNRTVDTAKVFVKAAFPNCTVPINVTLPNNTIFPYRIYNVTQEFIDKSAAEMRRKLDKTDFKDTYSLLNNLTDIKNSRICERDGLCDLNEGKDEIFFKIEDHPHIKGRFKIGSALVDSLLMSFYEGFSFEELGWDDIDEDKWRVLIKIVNEKMKIGYKLKQMRIFIRPLLKYFKTVSEDSKKLTLIVGHDTNLVALMSCLGFKSYKAFKKFEKVPIGGKLVFQKWSDGVEDFFKTELVYQTWNQMRGSEKLTSSNQPRNITLYFKSFEADDNGMYPWSIFRNKLNDLVQ